jgi:hypothetical protein
MSLRQQLVLFNPIVSNIKRTHVMKDGIDTWLQTGGRLIKLRNLKYA